MPPWESLSPDERRRYARYMEVYAAMVSTVDASLGVRTDPAELVDLAAAHPQRAAELAAAWERAACAGTSPSPQTGPRSPRCPTGGR